MKIDIADENRLLALATWDKVAPPPHPLACFLECAFGLKCQRLSCFSFWLWFHCNHGSNHSVCSTAMTGCRPGVGVDAHEALVTAERSGVVTRAAEPGTTTACARIDAFSANSVWLYWRPCIAESFIRGHGGNVDGGSCPRHPKWQKQQQRRQSFNGAQPRLQLIFNASSIAGRRPRFNLAIAKNPAGNQPTFSTPLHRRFLSTCGPMVPPIKQEVKRSPSTTALRALGLPGTIFNRRAARLPATRLIRSNGE